MRPTIFNLSNPWAIFALWLVLCAVVFFQPLTVLVNYSLHNDNASHILVIPLIVAWLFFLDRHKIPHSSCADLPAAFPFALAAALIGALATMRFGAHSPTGLSLFTLSLLLSWVAGFLAIFGRRTAKAVWFALAFLAFAIPLPEQLLNRFIYVLQLGSAAVAESIFNLSGVPFLREGFVFHLAGWNIEVARECSGIRSSIALVILALLVAHFSFNKFWKKAVFVLAGLLMMVVKNGVRIATLTLLAKYVDPNFLFGRLHHEGGVVFFLIGLALLLPVYLLLRRGDLHLASRPSVSGS
jgi:exosortase